MQIRKICIKSIAVLMAAIVMVSTPLSRFADTKGVSETHAVAPALITLGGLFGAIAGAYGLYVAVDKLADYAENWFSWTADNATDARTDLQKIKDGVTSYVLTKAVTNSVADFLATKVSDNYSYTSQGVPYNFNHLPDNGYSSRFVDDIVSTYEYPLLVSWSDVAYESGWYTLYYVNPIVSTTFKNMIADNNVEDILYYFAVGDTGASVNSYFHYQAFDKDGLPLYFDQCSSSSDGIRSVKYRYESGGWVSSHDSSFYNRIDTSTLNAGFYYFPAAMYVVQMMHGNGALKQDIIDKSVRADSLVIDYKTHGDNALDNVDALTGAEVSEETLTHLYDVSSEAYQNYLKSQQDNNDNNDDINYAPLASAMTAAIIASLKDMGYIKNPTDEPSGENVKEQLGNIQISLDGLIDAISQINPAQGLANIAQGIAGLPQKITASVTDAIRNVFEDLFVPDEGAIQDKVDEITDKFAFADSLLTVVDDIDGALKNASGPPEIYIHFEDAEDSKYTPIGTLKLLSFEWYERYKPYGDALLSSMLWLFFLWKVRKHIAEIVQGLSVSGESDANASANSAIGIERGRSS